MPNELLAGIVAELRSLSNRFGTPSVAAVQETVADFPACVLVADDRGRLVAASHVALSMIGHTVTSVRGLSVSDVSDPREPAEILWETFRRERMQTGTYALRGADRRVLPTRYAAVANVLGELSVAVHVPRMEDVPAAPEKPQPGDVIIRGGTSTGGFVLVDASLRDVLTASISSFRQAFEEAKRIADGHRVWREQSTERGRSFVLVPLEQRRPN